LALPSTASRKAGRPSAGRWPLRHAKARFSELVRKAQDEGTQHVTIHGRESVVVLSEAEYSRLTGTRSGKLLVDLLANSPHEDARLERANVRGPVRDVDV
jgi:prevent-host-death family protein